jgi:ATP-dependent helicase/nuclease subunit A
MSSPVPTATDQQRTAIELRGGSVALSAGAGCGKTFVLGERFLSYLAPQPKKGKPLADLADLVAFTYTDRAAREMRDRIRRKCRERLIAADDEAADYWLDLVRQLEAARISTVHSFCTSLLRAHAVEAGLDPNFSVLDAALAESLRRECLDDVLRERLASQEAATLDLVRRCGLGQARQRIAALLGARDKRSMAAFCSLSPSELAARWRELWLAMRQGAIEALLRSDSCIESLALARAAIFPHEELNRKRQDLVEQLPKFAEDDDPAGPFATIRSATLCGNLTAQKHWNQSSEWVAHYKAVLATLREELDHLKKIISFDGVLAQDAAKLSLDALALAMRVEDRYGQLKRERRSLDFDDLIVKAHALLTDPNRHEPRGNISRNLKLLLVDESQDTNPLQVELITALCGDDGLASGKLFFVGDYKQSIYRFLGADPRVFHNLRERIGQPGRLPLSENFRSQPAILDFVNAIFCDAFDDYEPLLATRRQVAPPPSVESLWAVERDFKRQGHTDLFIAKEAENIARRLAEMLDTAQLLIPEPARSPDESPKLRAVRPGDIAILFRTLSDVAVYEKELARLGLPYYLVGGKAFYAQQEVFDLSNLLRTLVHPADEVSLVGVLRSPFFSLADETLFWLAQSPGGLSQGLFSDQPPPQLEQQQREAVLFAADTIQQLRALKDRLLITDLINRALALTGYDAALVAEFMGERKLANLRKLLDKARVFDQSGFATLADFVVQLSEFEADQPDEGLAAMHAETSDVIRLMTIHQAKGLEFPVVVVTDLDRPRRQPGVVAAFDPQWGPVVSLPEEPGTQKLPTGYIRQFEEQEDRERTRLLYVAMTRAADYLILSSSFQDPQQPQGPWAQLVAKRFHLDSGTPREPWPKDCTAREVRVAPDPPEPDKTRAATPAKDLSAIIEPDEPAPLPADLAFIRDVEPIDFDSAARRVFSFSRLTGLLQALPELLDEERRPIAGASDGRDREDAALFGTLVHAILADVGMGEPADVSSLAARHAERLFWADSDRLGDAVAIVERFLLSRRAAEIKAARVVHREIEFLLAWPPDRDTADGAPLLQGFIDCLYQDAAGRWHILDYKSHDVAADRIDAEGRRYQLQLGLYALAAEKVFKQPLATMALQFLRPGAEVLWEWNDAIRATTIEEITALLARQIRSPGHPRGAALAVD